MHHHHHTHRFFYILYNTIDMHKCMRLIKGILITTNIIVANFFHTQWKEEEKNWYFNIILLQSVFKSKLCRLVDLIISFSCLLHLFFLFFFIFFLVFCYFAVCCPTKEKIMNKLLHKISYKQMMLLFSEINHSTNAIGTKEHIKFIKQLTVLLEKHFITHTVHTHIIN